MDWVIVRSQFFLDRVVFVFFNRVVCRVFFGYSGFVFFVGGVVGLVFCFFCLYAFIVFGRGCRGRGLIFFCICCLVLVLLLILVLISLEEIVERVGKFVLVRYLFYRISFRLIDYLLDVGFRWLRGLFYYVRSVEFFF